MRFKIIVVEVFALFVSYLVFSISLASATNVNIMYNGVVQETANYDQESLVNMHISVSRDSSDISWTKVKLLVTLNSASLSRSIKKIYLYKCRSQVPTECVRNTPQVFDSYADTELLWSDISEKTGAAQYPAVANLLFIVKMQDLNGKEMLTGFFSRTTRTNYNVFATQQLSLSDIDVHAKRLDLVQPIKSYIENKLLIPVRWTTKVVFTGATSLYGLGASSSDVDSHSFQTAVTSSNEITNINKDFYFVLPKIGSGTGNPIVLNLNPSFTCGDNRCDADIGETQTSCCYDCGCPANQYCDAPANINLSTCKNDTSSISVVSATSLSITDCSKGFSTNISVMISNPPTSLASQLQGTVALNQTNYAVTCFGGSGQYECSIPLTSTVKCGGGSYVIGPGMLNLTLSYKDGSDSATKVLSRSFSGISVTYDCKCQDGKYCDSAKKTCQSESSITLGIASLTSYLDNYTPGDRIILTAKIFNPPAYVALVSKRADMNLTNGQVAPGTPDCDAPNSLSEYTCRIPFQIANYDKTQAYTFQPNTLYFDITYPDGLVANTKTISAPFGPVSIPAQYCGNGRLDPGETTANCCVDIACTGTNQYCDKGANSCSDKGVISLAVTSVSPANISDCNVSHAVDITGVVNNAPSNMTIVYYSYLQNGAANGWKLQSCSMITTGVFNCTLIIPVISGCSLPYKTISGNAMNMTISFPDGKSKLITRTMTASFQNILIAPMYHCGDGSCESDIGESSANCCYDCKCADSPAFGDRFYCDSDQKTFLGTCIPKADIGLVLDSPKTTVNLDTCEITSDVNIKVHIRNQPKNAVTATYYAIINGTSAQMIQCSQETIPGITNFTLNCTLRLPSMYGCMQGKTYAYSPNSFSLLLTYQNGAGKTEAQTLTTGLPDIVVRQGVRTLYDITQEGIAKIKQRMQTTMDIMHAMMDAIKSCMEMVQMLSYLTLALTVAGAVMGYNGGLETTKTTQSGTTTTVQQNKMSGALTGATAGSQIGSTIMAAYAKFCDYLQTIYQVDIKIQQAEINMIQMEMCMDTYQHMLDTGQCDKLGQANGCFQSMVGCVKFDQLDSTVNSITATVRAGTTDLSQMTSIINNLNNISLVSNGQATVSMQCNSADSSECCQFNTAQTQKVGVTGDKIVNQCKNSAMRFASTGTINCPGGVYIVIDGTSTKYPLNSDINTDGLITNGLFNDTGRQYTIYCKSSSSATTGTSMGSATIKLLKGDQSTCTCKGSSNPNNNQGGTGTVEAIIKPSATEINPGETVSISCKGNANNGATIDYVELNCVNGDPIKSYNADTELLGDCKYSCKSDPSGISQYSPTCTVKDTARSKSDYKQVLITCKSMAA